ncbi:MAG: urease accessory protein UreD [Paucibacter sp.]|nr:urease accessory protein UreD [Roseateles sp.]
MSWHAHLQIEYRVDATGATRSHDRFEGPLRVLQSLYPEGPQVCQHVIVHPPGGIVGGDTLDVDLHLGAHSHALLTTAGATRFYRSAGPQAAQRLRACAAAGSRLEWLPLEAIAYDGVAAENRVVFELEPGAEMIGWDVLALGLPAAGQPFVRGCFAQHLELPGRWLERGRLHAEDTRLLDSPLGLAGRRTLGCLWFAAGGPLAPARRTQLLDAARQHAGVSALAATAGATSPEPGVVVLRVLAERVEPLMALFRSVWADWRHQAWGKPAVPPRVWRT